jgi:DNA-binding XRE family transcriptional regulator
MKNNLEEILKEQGRKITWLANQVGVHRTTITRIISGAPPQIDLAYKIAKELNKSVFEIWPP